MPYGFVGNAAQKYLSNVGSSLSAAGEANSKNSSSKIAPSNRNAPYSADSAMGGGHAVGVGNQTNIVVDQGTYDDIMQKIRVVDERAAEDLYNVAVQIEEMCSTIYIVPQTLPRYTAILDSVKSSLGEFQSLAEETGIQIRRFVNEMMEVNRG